ncbi:MAG: ferritin family protein [Candidatus Aminicenantales bacterium]
MKKISRDVKILIEEAIKLEINGQAFFKKAADLTHNELGKKMFHRLADEEVKHLDAFSRLFSSVIKSEDWKKQVEREKLKDSSPVIEELEKRMRRAEGQSEVEALRIGMELEEKAIDFFGQAAGAMGDPKAKEIFKKIADEERFHYDLLQAQYDSVTGSGFWLDSAEFQMDGKY